MDIGLFVCKNDKNFGVEECEISQINVVSKREIPNAYIKFQLGVLVGRAGPSSIQA